MTERSTAAVSDSSCTYNNNNTIIPKWFNTTITEKILLPTTLLILTQV
jgi:hypothetical protein